ncbi:Rho GTPase activation protein [Coprinopsis marcescibilis]|uniref:Rho GTPase activation protein n=1 Tax=Coprinopsis marcescibilis TaxID=230819 RepID=A0A5C3L4B4_COPMA|nr:Rho GTPase activation protein [Coprinopsis marcescibilis]
MPPNTATLKQRLAALSLSPSSPSSYNTDSGSTDSLRSSFAAKRKSLFQPPWKRDQQGTSVNGNVGYAELEAVQEVLGKMIFQAAVDYETRPMVVLNASALPDPQLVSYDLLLSQILAYLNLYVEADYTVVFFAAGNRYTPGWNWIWKAYRSLNRKYRKNLKQLYIVHSSFFSKMLFSLAGAIISPKFFRKLVYITTLSELAHHVPLTQIDIPPAVYQENLKYERKITLPVPVRSSTFGVPLEELMGFDGEKGGIPRVVRDCIQYIRGSGMLDEGLFRRSPSSVLLRAAQDAYDRGNVVSLHTFGDPHLAAVLLKKYLRDLPEPLFPEHLYPLIRRCPTPTNNPADMNCVNYLRDTLLPALAPCAYILLSNILHLLHDISLRAASNRMDEYNLAIVICPNLVKGSNPIRDVSLCAVVGAPALTAMGALPAQESSFEGKTSLGNIIAFSIRRYYEIFDDIPDPAEPLHSADVYSPSIAPSSLPNSPYVIHDEDEDLEDDDMLVMPVNGTPPSAWGAPVASAGPFAKRHRSRPSASSTGTGSSGVAASVRTLRGDASSTNPPPNAHVGYATAGRAKSLINIEKGLGHGKKGGSISVGRGTMRKASGAQVETIGVTAEGFFAPPKDAPPVPPMSPPTSAFVGGPPTGSRRASVDGE